MSTSFQKIPFRSLFFFTLPTIGFGYMFGLVNLYLLIFATDYLHIAPAVVGLIFGISRLWDAFSDPIVGYLSDRTRSRWGRRRPWLAASAIPIGLAFFILFNSSPEMSDVAKGWWLGLGIILFYSASTLFYVPHFAIGAELTDDYHQRNTVFGFRHAGWLGGYILGIGGIWLLTKAAADGQAAVLELAGQQAAVWGTITAIALFLCAANMRERPEFVSKGGAAALPAMLDVFRNPHARNILLVVFIDNISFALTSSMVLYVCTYILQQPLAATKFILAFMLPSFLLVPIWMPLARRYGKKYLYLFSILLSAMAFGAMFNLGVGDELLMLVLGAMAGLANGCGMTIGPSIYADVIDYDELQTGQRKEGAYFAVWSFVWKSATGLVLMVIGVVLSYVGFVPNETQSEPVILAMRLMFTIIPCFCYLLGGMVFAMFALNETAYQGMRVELDAQRSRTDS